MADRNGEASGGRVLISGIAGVPGGISVDEKGVLYIAATGIAIYTPEGRSVRTLGIQDPQDVFTFPGTNG